ncbi:hypothetical protein VV11_010240 [Trichodesmium erythraeum 21-75]|nr:hypothetical protein [Trichodesmium erythraeum 21-75]
MAPFAVMAGYNTIISINTVVIKKAGKLLQKVRFTIFFYSFFLLPLLVLQFRELLEISQEWIFIAVKPITIKATKPFLTGISVK